MKHTHLLVLTARLLARPAALRGEGEGDPPKKTRAEWEAERQQELAAKSVTELAQKVSQLEFDNRELRRAAPKDGARVLSAEDASEFDALKALGTAKELKTRLEKGDADGAKLTARERGDVLRDVAEAGGLNLKALTRLAGDLQFEVGAEVEQDGKKSRPVTVKDGNTAKPLGEYLRQEWADMAPALLPAAGTQQTQGQQFARQDGTGATGAGNGQSWVQSTIAAQSKATGYVDPLQAAGAKP